MVITRGNLFAPGEVDNRLRLLWLSLMIVVNTIEHDKEYIMIINSRNVMENKRRMMSQRLKDDLVRVAEDFGDGDLYGLTENDARKLWLEKEGIIEEGRQISKYHAFNLVMFGSAISPIPLLSFGISPEQGLFGDPRSFFPIIAFLVLVVILIVTAFCLSYKADNTPAKTGVSGVLAGFMYRIMNLNYIKNNLWNQYAAVTELVDELNVHKMPLSSDDPEWNKKIDEIATALVDLDENLSASERNSR